MNSRKIFNTTCTMDCPDTCSLEVTVENEQIKSITGSKEQLVTNGFICSKVSKFAKRVYSPDRLLYPMQRIGKKGEGKFMRISWEQALDIIANKFKKIKSDFGGEAILPYHYGGSNGFLGDDFIDSYFFARLGASRLLRTLCAIPTSEVSSGMYGKMPGVAFDDFPKAKFILIWGANPKVSNIHLVPFLKKAKENGAFITVVDPVNNFSDSEIDLHIPVFPGTDLPMALALILYWKENNLIDTKFLQQHCINSEKLFEASKHWTLEKASGVCKVRKDDIKLLAQKYAESSPALLRCGWGVERNKNGGQAVAAIMAMPALLGKFGIRGGGYTLSNGSAVKMDKEKIFGKTEWKTREINMTQLGKLLNGNLKPAIKSLFIYNCNPVATVPDQNAVIRGLLRDELFTVVFDQVMTDSAKYADVLLPAVTFLEQKEIKRGYGNYMIGGVQPVIKAQGEAKTNEEVFALLAKHMGYSENFFNLSSEKLMKNVLKNMTFFDQPVNSNTLMEGKFQNGESPVQFKSVFPATEKDKIDLCPAQLGNRPFEFLPIVNIKYPLALISPATSKMISSTFGEFNYAELKLLIHPFDAGIRKLKNGDKVRIFNNLGEVHCPVRISTKIRKGVVILPKGAWQRSSLNGQTSTALCPDHLNVVGGGACYNDARVEVEKLL